jgi:hypothetical protein
VHLCLLWLLSLTPARRLSSSSLRRRVRMYGICSSSSRCVYPANLGCSVFHDVHTQIFYSSMLGLLEPKAIMVVFANVEDILLTNTTFLSSLEERQRSCRLYIDNIGDILNKHLTNMTSYKVRLYSRTHLCHLTHPHLGVLRQPRERDPDAAIATGEEHRSRNPFTSACHLPRICVGARRG